MLGFIPVALIIYLLIVVMFMVNAYRTNTETLIWNPKKEDCEGKKIYREDLSSEQIAGKIMIASEHNIYDVYICPTIINERTGKWKLNKKQADCLKDILSPKECFILRVTIAELLPQYAIVFYNKAFMKAVVPIYMNGRYGNKTETVRYTITFKSFLYFLCLGIIKYKE